MLHVLVPPPAVRGDRISHLPSVARIPPAARGRLAFRKSPRRDNRHPVGTLCEGGSGAPDALSHRRKGKPRPGAGRLRSNAISETRAPYAVPNRLATLALILLYRSTVRQSRLVTRLHRGTRGGPAARARLVPAAPSTRCASTYGRVRQESTVVYTATSASSLAVSARPPISAVSIFARAGSPISAATEAMMGPSFIVR